MCADRPGPSSSPRTTPGRHPLGNHGPAAGSGATIGLHDVRRAPAALPTPRPASSSPELVARRAVARPSVQERATLLANQYERVLILTTGFAPRCKVLRRALRAGASTRGWRSRTSSPTAGGSPARRPAREWPVRRSPAGRAHDPAAGAAEGATLPPGRLPGGCAPVPVPLLRPPRAGRCSRPAPGGESKHERRVNRPEDVARAGDGWSPTGSTTRSPTCPARPVLAAARDQRPGPARVAQRGPQDRLAAQLPLQRPRRPRPGHQAELPPLLANAAKVDAIVCQTAQQLARARPEDMPGGR